MSIYFGRLKGEPVFRLVHTTEFAPPRRAFARRQAPDGSKGAIEGVVYVSRKATPERDSFYSSSIRVGDDEQEQLDLVFVTTRVLEGKVEVGVKIPPDDLCNFDVSDPDNWKNTFEFEALPSELNAKLEAQEKMQGLSVARQEEVRDALALHEKMFKLYFLDVQA